MVAWVRWKRTKSRVAGMWGRASRHRRWLIVGNSMQARLSRAQLGVAHNTPSPMATCSPSHLSHPTFCSLPSHSSHHPSKPHQIKQSLSKRAVNKRVVGKRQSFLQNRWSGYLLYCKLLLYLQCGLATFRTEKRRPDIAFSGQYPIRPWNIANIGRWNNRTNVTPEFNYT